MSMDWSAHIDERALTRFWAKVEKADECWPWVAATNSKGYGIFRLGPACVLAHRLSWFISNGAFAQGLVLDHLCRVRNCVNPDHLEEVTNFENTMRGETIPAARAAQTHCIHGHEFTPENTLYRREGTRTTRNCHTCKKRIEAARRLRVRAAA